MFNLEIQSVSCEDYILYYDSEMKIGFEAQFDNGEFNNIIYSCRNPGDDNEVWEKLNNEIIFNLIKVKALQDYNRLGE